MFDLNSKELFWPLVSALGLMKITLKTESNTDRWLQSMHHLTYCCKYPKHFRGFNCVPCFFLVRYEQPSGYWPAPVDLSQVLLSLDHEEVVRLLAENDHNIWARERIRQGWTYGTQQVYVLCHFYCYPGSTEEKVMF